MREENNSGCHGNWRVVFLMTEFKLVPANEEQRKIDKEFDPYFCRMHRWAVKENFILVTIKKTKENVIRCGYCEREKYESKKIRSQQWQDHKERITPYYVRRLLSLGRGLSMDAIPDELVEVKQAVVKLKRMTDKMNQPLKKCTKHGKLYKDDVIKSGKEASGNPKWRCRHCMRELHAKHYDLHKAKVLAAHKSYKERNPEKVAQSKKESRKKNRHKHKDSENLRKKLAERKHTRELSDRYMKKSLVKRTNLSMSDIPQSLIDCKRALMQLKRSVRTRMDQQKIEKLEEQLDGKK